MYQLPNYVKEYWAKKLGSNSVRGKARKRITALREVWPIVTVGWWNGKTRTMIDYDEDLEDEHGELEVVKRCITESEAESLAAEQIMAAFEAVSITPVLENRAQC
jgi:hypothetical protein